MNECMYVYKEQSIYGMIEETQQRVTLRIIDESIDTCSEYYLGAHFLPLAYELNK